MITAIEYFLVVMFRSESKTLASKGLNCSIKQHYLKKAYLVAFDSIVVFHRGIRKRELSSNKMRKKRI